jgi:hypothetical protein
MKLVGVGVAWVLANLADWWTTERGVASGRAELNPLMAPLVGTPWFLLVKVVVPVAVIWWTLRHPRYGPALLAAALVVAMAAVWNFAAVGA